MDFRKIKLNRTSMSIDVTYIENIEINETFISNEVAKKCSMIVHKDLLDAMDSLKIHFALLCDLREVAAFPNSYEISQFDHKLYLDKISISGITIGGEDDSAGVVIIGRKELSSGVLNLVTPFTRFQGDDYAWTADLETAVQNLCNETDQYLDGKCGAKQLSLPFAEEFADGEEPFGSFEDMPDMEVAEIPEKKKPARGRKKKESVPVLEPAC